MSATKQTECRPPAGHERHSGSWHWIRYRAAIPGQNPWAVAMWLPFDCWVFMGRAVYPAELHEMGWDYVAPAVPPERSDDASRT